MSKFFRHRQSRSCYRPNCSLRPRERWHQVKPSLTIHLMCKMHLLVSKRLETACRCRAQPVDLELQPRPEKVSRLVGPAVLIPPIIEKCYEKRRCGVLCKWEVCFVTLPKHFDPRQDGRSNLQVGSLPRLCADVEQELLLFWRGDVEASIINGDSSRAAEKIPADVEEKDTVTTLDMGSRKVTVVSSLQSAPGIASDIRTRPLFRRTLPGRRIFGQGRLSHLAPVHMPVHLHVHSESRFALPSCGP